MTKIKYNKDHLKYGIKHGYRSGLEEKIANELDSLGVEYQYEEKTLEFIQPAVSRKYTPDFVLPNGLIIETKGRFTVEDRKKMLLVKSQHPDLDIRLVFSNPNARLYKKSKTRYWQWCEKHGFKWAKRSIPLEWINERSTNA